ncbi:hypothetical protein THRCLA_02667 [Thraustotheca clavata]|uniref:SEC7 domain-containing protein n=1 Tax=Thraustotheca clavata TaxID=74557 RepID=A0A1W0A4D7_9STRA|nr:hypothetical protein THRCLA_02667 [Thraustotheca clavata]
MEALRCATLSGIQTLIHIKSNQVNELAKLRGKLQQWTNPHDFEPQLVLQPFLDIIRNENTTGPLTRSAMEAVCTILHVYDENSALHGIPMQHALADVLDAVTQCRFQETEPNSDQYVLLTVVRVLDIVLQCRAAATLTDDTIWHVVDALFAIARSNDARISNVIRGVATDSLQRMMQVIFDPMEILTESSRAFGLPCAVKVLGFLCLKIQPSSKSSEKEVLLSLQLLQTVLMKLGSHIKDIPSLLTYAHDELCGAILSWLRLGSLTPGQDNIDIPLSCLSILRLIWCYIRSCLKMQWEVMLQGLVPGVMDRTLALEWRVELLQCLVDFLADASFVIDIFVQYDCNADRSNVLELVLTTLYQIIQGSTDPDDFSTEIEPEMIDVALLGYWNILNVLHQRTLMEFDMIVGPPVEASNQVLSRRQRKKLFQEAIAAFNVKPLTGITLLESEGFVPSPVDATSLGWTLFMKFAYMCIARVLRSLPPGLDKNCVGQFLGTMGKEPGPTVALTDTSTFHQQLLHAYVAAFDFQDMYLVEALRVFLSSFRLPGEAQQIDRILECFSKQVFEQCRERALFASSVDVPYLLSFSIIMLNTDLHNANIRADRKMTIEDFLKNNSNYGIPGASPLPTEYLTSIYHAIRTSPIRTCDDAEEVTSERWRDLQRIHAATPATERIMNSFVHTPEYDAYVLEYVANDFLLPLLPVLSEMALFPQVLNQLVSCAQAAASLHCTELFGKIVAILGEQSSLCSSHSNDQAIEATVYTYCSDVVASTATIGILQLWKSCSNHFDEASWAWFLSILARLREYQLLPSSLLLERRSFLTQDERVLYVETTQDTALVKLQSSKQHAKSLSTPTSSFFSSVSRFFAMEPISAPSSPLHTPTSTDSPFSSYRKLDINDLFFPSTEDDTDVMNMVTQPWIDDFLSQCPLHFFYEHMQALSDQSIRSFFTAACSQVQRVFQPPSKTKLTPGTLSPGGAIFIEQIAMRVLSSELSKDIWRIVLEHAEAIIKSLDPFIRGNLHVQGMGYESAVYLLETLLTGLLYNGQSQIVNILLLLESMDMDLLAVFARPLLKGIFMDQLTLEAWSVWLRIVLRCSAIRSLDDYSFYCLAVLEKASDLDNYSALVPLLTLLAHTASVHAHSTQAILTLERVLSFETSLWEASMDLHDVDKLSILGALSSQLTHPSTLTSDTLRLSTLTTLRRCALESPDSMLEPSSWLALLRYGLIPLTGVEIPGRSDSSNELNAALEEFALEMPEGVDLLPTTSTIMDMVVALFLHHLDDWMAPAAQVEFPIVWNEILFVFTTRLQMYREKKVSEEALVEQLRNVVHVVFALNQEEDWFIPSVQHIATLCPQIIVWKEEEPISTTIPEEQSHLVDETQA